ncbi:MAG: WD40 repeat domain-containing protein [Gemmataceae bacterium]
MILLLLACAAGPFVRPADVHGDPLPPHAVARLGTERFRLDHRAYTADVSPDGRWIAATEGWAVTLFDANTGLRVARIDLDQEVTALRFSGDGQRLVAAGSAVAVIDVGKRAVEVTMKPKTGRVEDVAVSGDGRRVAYAQGRGVPSGLIEVYSIPDRRVIRAIEIRSRGLRGLALSPEGDRVAAVADLAISKGGLKVWDVNTGKEGTHPAPAASPGAVLAFSPDRKTFAVAGNALDSRLWELGANRSLGPLGRDRAATAVTFARDGKRLAVAGRDGVSLYDARTGDRVHRADGPAGSLLTGVRVLPGGAALAVGVSGHSARLVPGATPDGHVGPVRSLAFAPAGRTLHSSSLDGVRSWEVGGWRQAAHADPEAGADRRYGDGFTSLSPSGRYSFTFRPFDKLSVHEWAAGKKLGEVAVKCAETAAPAVSADETRFAVVGTARAAADGDVQRALIVELPSMRRVASVVLPFGPRPATPAEIALSPDGSRLVAADRTAAVVFDAATGRERGRVARFGHAGRPAFSPDGRWLALPGRGEVEVRDAETLDAVLALPLPAGRVAPLAAFSPDSRLLAVAREAGVRRGRGPAAVAVYELASRSVRAAYPVRASSLAFAPGSWRLAVGAACCAEVYDLSGLARLRPPARPADPWADLDAPDAARAADAASGLLSRPGDAVGLIAARLTPAGGKPLSARLVDRRVEDLKDPVNRVRAEELLAEAGPRLAGLLADRLRAADHPDATASLKALLRAARAWPGEGMLRPVRAVEVLERLATPEARELLEALAAGNPDARPTAEAKAALGRVRR